MKNAKSKLTSAILLIWAGLLLSTVVLTVEIIHETEMVPLEIR